MPGRRLHVALGVSNIEASVEDYSRRLGGRPTVLVPGEYALWRSEAVNLSIRKAVNDSGLRHLGWEDAEASAFTQEMDVNGITWERFTATQQLEEIEAAWPGTCLLLTPETPL